jgi:predicted transcriptional regulator
MSSRPTPSALPPAVETDCEDLSEADRVALEEAEAAVARGEWVTHEVAMAKLDAMIAEFSAKCRD